MDHTNEGLKEEKANLHQYFTAEEALKDEEKEQEILRLEKAAHNGEFFRNVKSACVTASTHDG